MKYFKRILLVLVAFLVLLLIYPTGYFVLNKQQGQAPIQYNKDKAVRGIGVYLVTLERFKDRHAYVMKSIGPLGLPVHKVSNIDGRDMSEAEFREKVEFEAYKRFLGDYPKRGIIGASLGHIEAWKIFLESDFEFALIFEDDVSFDSTTLSKTLDLLVQNTKLWDITSFDVLHGGMPLTLKQFKNPNERLAVYLTEVTHSGGYIITRKAAAALLEKALPIKMPVDHYFTRSWELGLKFAGIEPRIVAQTYGDSTIAMSSGSGYSGNKGNNAAMYLHKAMYKLQSCIIRFLYNLAVYLELKLTSNS